MNIFSCGAPHLYVVHEVFIEVPLFQKICSACAPITLILTFQTNFHPNIWVFPNLPIYKKLIHDNISLVF